MRNIMEPVAISGVQTAAKIRSVIFTNNRLAHVPLNNILKLAVETDQDKQFEDVNINHPPQDPANTTRHFIFLNEKILIQYGFSPSVFNGEGDKQPIIEVKFSRPFFTVNYCPMLTLSSDKDTAKTNSFIACQDLQKTGFKVVLNNTDHTDIQGVFWLAIGIVD